MSYQKPRLCSDRTYQKQNLKYTKTMSEHIYEFRTSNVEAFRLRFCCQRHHSLAGPKIPIAWEMGAFSSYTLHLFLYTQYLGWKTKNTLMYNLYRLPICKVIMNSQSVRPWISTVRLAATKDPRGMRGRRRDLVAQHEGEGPHSATWGKGPCGAAWGGAKVTSAASHRRWPEGGDGYEGGGGVAAWWRWHMKNSPLRIANSYVFKKG